MGRGALPIGLAAALALSGCASSSVDNLTKVMNTLSTNYAHCKHGVTYSAILGGMNPASGVSVQGSIDCPALPVAAPTAAATPAASVVGP